jgi:hypothetical protein
MTEEEILSGIEQENLTTKIIEKIFERVPDADEFLARERIMIHFGGDIIND